MPLIDGRIAGQSGRVTPLEPGLAVLPLQMVSGKVRSRLGMDDVSGLV
jgi:hypothetical protein